MGKRSKESVCQRESLDGYQIGSVCVDVRDRERKSVCVCLCQRKSVCVCLFERYILRVTVRMTVCVSERDSR